MKRLIIVFFMCSTACFSTYAAEKELKLSVEDAVRLALENNTDIKQAQRSLAALERAKNTSWNSISPSLSASGSYSQNLKSEGSSGNFSLSGSARMNLSPSLATTMKSAKLSYEAGELTYEDTLRSVELNVRKSFYNLLLAEENIAMQKRSMEAAKRQYEVNQEKYNRGSLSEIDLLSSQVNYQSKIPGIESQENAIIASVENFKQVLGLGRDVELELSGSIENFEKFDESAVKINFEKVSSVKKLKNQIESAKTKLLATRFSAYGPSLSVGVSVNGGINAIGSETPARDYYALNSFTGAIEKVHADATKSSFKLNEPTLSLGLSIPLDGLLPWSNGALSIKSQKDSLKTLEENLEITRNKVELSVESSLRTIRQALSQKKSLEATAELAQKTYELTQTAYNHGSKDLLSLKAAEDNVLSARTQLQQQNYTLVSAVLDLENTLGLPLGSLTSGK